MLYKIKLTLMPQWGYCNFQEGWRVEGVCISHPVFPEGFGDFQD